MHRRFQIARSFVIGKVANQRAVLMRALRDHGAEMPPETRVAIEGATGRIAHMLRRASFTDATLDALRGSAGEAATLYFSVFDHLIRSPDPELHRRGRSRRPPLVMIGDDVRLALMLAQAEPRSVDRIVAISAAFPILNDVLYSSLIPLARFVRACARCRPGVLNPMLRGIHLSVAAYGVERYLRELVSRAPTSAHAITDPDIAEAIISGVNYMYFSGPPPIAALAAEQAAFHSDWPPLLGDVSCNVTLVHGEEDSNSPFENAQRYTDRLPHWRLVSFPGEGEFVQFTC